MVIYFSGTGNSRRCALALSKGLDDGCTDAFRYIRDGIAGEFASVSPYVFVCPTYAWQMPAVFENFIRSASFSGSRDAYFVMTCGGETGGAQSRIMDLCGKKGLAFRGLLPVVMPDNYIVMFRSPSPEEIREKLLAADALMEKAAGAILQGKKFPRLSPGALDRIKSGPVNRGMYRFYIRTKPFYSTDRCVSCGKCAEVCPLGTIRLEKGRPVWSRECTHCMACISSCPVSAIEYGKKTKGKARYRCPVK